MFNFRSLAAMIGEEEKAENSAHVENADEEPSPTDGRDEYPLGKNGERGASHGLGTSSSSNSNSPDLTEEDSGLRKSKPVVETSAAMSDM